MILRTDFHVNKCIWKFASVSAPDRSSPASSARKIHLRPWGDTVNIASRITSEGVPGMVQVDKPPIAGYRTASTSRLTITSGQDTWWFIARSDERPPRLNDRARY